MVDLHRVCVRPWNLPDSRRSRSRMLWESVLPGYSSDCASDEAQLPNPMFATLIFPRDSMLLSSTPNNGIFIVDVRHSG
jgi:hypothetical protein